MFYLVLGFEQNTHSGNLGMSIIWIFNEIISLNGISQIQGSALHCSEKQNLISSLYKPWSEIWNTVENTDWLLLKTKRDKVLNIQQKARTQLEEKQGMLFFSLSHFFSSSLQFPSSLRSHSISPDNTALIIAELHWDNHLVESRAAAAEAVWENPSRLLQPACLPANCAGIYVY